MFNTEKNKILLIPYQILNPPKQIWSYSAKKHGHGHGTTVMTGTQIRDMALCNTGIYKIIEGSACIHTVQSSNNIITCGHYMLKSLIYFLLFCKRNRPQLFNFLWSNSLYIISYTEAYLMILLYKSRFWQYFSTIIFDIYSWRWINISNI